MTSLREDGWATVFVEVTEGIGGQETLYGVKPLVEEQLSQIESYNDF